MPFEDFAFVTPWYHTGDLASFLMTQRAFSRLQLIKGIASGLWYIHSEGLCHGNLRPSNVLLSDDLSPVLGGIGLGEIRKLTDANFTGPTDLSFLPPEYFRASGGLSSNEASREVGIVTPALDVYSFAMTCFQVVTAESPFGPMQLREAIIAVIAADERPVRPQNSERSELSDEM